MESKKLASEHALPFILGGNALFTLRSLKTGKRFTYKVTAPKKNDTDTTEVYWVRLLTGADNENTFTYIGFIKKQNGVWGFIPKIGGNGSHYLEFGFNKIISLELHNVNLEVWHEGKCCRCGRTLTVPESIEDGIGPECKKVKSKKLRVA
jgi:hypothetical protein